MSKPTAVQRILIIGMSGAGKSTLCRKLAADLKVSPSHLDNIYHLPGWVARPNAEVERDFNEIAARDVWVADGNYRRLSKNLRERAQLIIFLDFNRWFCLRQILTRYLLHHYGWRKRVDLGAGFEEKMSWEFIHYVLQWPQQNRVRWLTELQPYTDKLLVLKNRKEVMQWLR